MNTVQFLMALQSTQEIIRKNEEERHRRELERQYLRELENQTLDFTFYNAYNKILEQREANKRK